ncbi:MAG: hypothetical protein ACRDNJ_15615 [Solirubrobacteraceae bacterium]
MTTVVIVNVVLSVLMLGGVIVQLARSIVRANRAERDGDADSGGRRGWGRYFEI